MATDPTGFCTNGCPAGVYTFGPYEVANSDAGENLGTAVGRTVADKLRDLAGSVLPVVSISSKLLQKAADGIGQNSEQIYFVGVAVGCTCGTPDKKPTIHTFQAPSGINGHGPAATGDGFTHTVNKEQWQASMDIAQREWAEDYNNWIDGLFPNCPNKGIHLEKDGKDLEKGK